MNRRDLLTSTGAGMALGFCAAVVVAAPGCAPTPAPAAEPISAGLTLAIQRHRTALEAAEAAILARRPFEWAEFDSRNPDPASRAGFQATDAVVQRMCMDAADAMDGVIAFPICNLADMRAKALYLAENDKHIDYAGEALDALLASMGASTDNLSAVSVMSAKPDPMLSMILQCRAALAVANSKDTTAEVDAAMEPVGALYDELESNTPQITTEQGALEALRFAHETMGHTHEAFIAPVIGAVLAYFDERA